MVALNFDATQYDPTLGMPVLSEGWHTGVITKSEPVPNKDDPSKVRLVLTGKVMDQGPDYNKAFFIGLNTQHPDEATVNRAFNELSAVCHATGVYQLQDTSQLHNIPFSFRTVIEPPRNGYDAQTRIKEYRTANGEELVQGGQPQGQQQGGGAWGGQQQQGQPQQNQQPQGQQQQPQQQQPDPNQNQQGGAGWGGQQQQQQQQHQQQQNPGWGGQPDQQGQQQQQPMQNQQPQQDQGAGWQQQQPGQRQNPGWGQG